MHARGLRSTIVGMPFADRHDAGRRPDGAAGPPSASTDREGATDPAPAESQQVLLDVDDGVELIGDLVQPHRAQGLVLFAHGSGSSRRSPRNRAVARTLNGAGFATLLFDLLTEPESQRRALVFDIALLARRLERVTQIVREAPGTRRLPVGYFGASTGAGAALRAAATLGSVVRAVVSRGGRPDLAGDRLVDVVAPTLLIVGSRDPQVLELNRAAAEQLPHERRVAVVEGATHLFEEPGTLEEVAGLASDWFTAHLRPPETSTAPGA